MIPVFIDIITLALDKAHLFTYTSIYSFRATILQSERQEDAIEGVAQNCAARPTSAVLRLYKAVARYR